MIAMFLLSACKEEKAIISVHAIQEVQAKVDEILKTQKPEEILVVYDVDMTLTQPDHPATYYPVIKKYTHALKDIFKALTPAQRDVALTLTSRLPQRLIEKDSPKIVRNMQAKGVQVIAFTASLSGSWKDHKTKTIFNRRDKLQALGFNFSFPGRVVSYMDFAKYVDGYPMLYHGVLCANGENGDGKGKVLEAFLKQVSINKDGTKNYIPTVIVMVDDKKANLGDIQKVLATSHTDIQFIGIEYQGAFDYAPQDISQAEFTKFWETLAAQAKLLCPR
jgi:hypothetical protein